MVISDLTLERHVSSLEAIGTFSEASIYHTAAWRQYLSEAFGAVNVSLCAAEGERLVGLLPLAACRTVRGGWRVVSLPFSHHVLPLGAPYVVERLLTEAARLAAERYQCRLELRGALLGTASLVRTEVPLSPNAAVLRAQLDRKVRNQLVQAERGSRLICRPATDEDGDALDRIMATNRRALGSATYPRGTFLRLRRWLGSALDIRLACVDREPVAFMATSVFQRRATYHYGASLPTARAWRPNNLLMWQTLCWAADRGASVIDLGTSLISQRGLVHFKEGWGGHSYPVSYGWIDQDRRFMSKPNLQGSRLARMAACGIRRMPLSWFERLTPFVLKELG